MDPLKPNDKQTQSASDLNKSLKHTKDVKEKVRSTSGDMDKKYIPQTTNDKETSADEESCNMNMLKRPSTSQETSKDKSVFELFPWLEDALKINLKYVGCITGLKSRSVLNALDTLIE